MSSRSQTGITLPPRTEHDLLGTRQVPGDVYYGIQTLRALENFPITGVPIATLPSLIRALAAVKKAAALANQELGLLPAVPAQAIVGACDEVMAGRLHDQFVVDTIQGGAGTSTNMNANEVIANRALELLGHPRGIYEHLHPNDHVNMSQSTNDVYPTAVKIAIVWDLQGMMEEMGRLRDALHAKAGEFHDVLKIARTQLQDAVPITLGLEFEAYAIMIDEDIQRVREATSLLVEVNMGATAVGTGLNTLPGYVDRVREHLRAITGLSLVTPPSLVEATQDSGVFVQLSGVLKRCSVKVSKICNDLRLLSSGPQAGLAEITLPAVQPGSSIMPGKINPVIPEVVNQIAFQVIGKDVTVTMAAEAGQLELNAMVPVIAYNLLKSIDLLRRGCQVLWERCIVGIRANRERCRTYVEESVGLAAALVPYIGYERAGQVATEALHTGKSVYQLVVERGFLNRDQVEEILKPENLLRPVQGPLPTIY